MFGFVLLGLILVSMVFLSRKWCIGPIISVNNSKKLHGKIVVITGATSGIGKATIRDLSQRGARILMLCRNCKTGDKIASQIGSNIETFQCDLSSLASVRSCAEEICKAVPRIDILINNAGIMACDKGHCSNGYDLQLTVNHLSHFLLTELLRPKMSESTFSKIIIVLSFCYIYGQIHWDDIHFEKSYSAMTAYGQSKLANVLHGLELSKRLPNNMRVYIVNPGVVNTNISRHSWILQLFFILGYPWIKSSFHGAQTLLHCILMDDSKSSVNTLYYSDCRDKKLSNIVVNSKDCQRFWDLSLKLIKKQ